MPLAVSTHTYRQARSRILKNIEFERRQIEVFSRPHNLYWRPDVVAQCKERIKQEQRFLAGLRKAPRFNALCGL